MNKNPLDVTNLSPEKKRVILAQLLQEKVKRSNVFPLSFAQERLWILHQFEDQKTAYNMKANMKLKGPLKVEVLEQGINEVIQRHEALRTTFIMKNGEPMQHIRENLTISLPVVDLQVLSRDEQWAEVRQIAAKEALKIFDLEKGPLLRMVLLKLAKEEHVLLLTMHHIISDGWSMRLFFREVARFYDAISRGGAPDLPDISFQYVDFAVWQRKWLAGAVLDSQLNYWKQQLAQAPPLLELPTDYPHQANQDSPGRTEGIRIDSSLTQKLRKLCFQTKTSLFMVLLAVFDILLLRYSSQEDIVVGTPMSNRNRPEIEPLIGFFVNTLVMRTDLSGNPGFLELLNRVRQVALGAYDHQDLPFERLVQELHPERNLGHSPLFQVMFVFQFPKRKTEQYSTISMSYMETETFSTQFDLVLTATDVKDYIRFDFEFPLHLYRNETIRGMCRHLTNIITAVAENPEIKISGISLLSLREKEELIYELNSNRIDFPGNRSIYNEIENHAAVNPGQVAIKMQDSKQTYGELNRRANRLARVLRTHGIERDKTVGILLKRSFLMVESILATWKAGGAYIPIDTDYPLQRIINILADSHTTVLLTQQEYVKAALEIKYEGKIIQLDTRMNQIEKESGANLNLDIDMNSLSYVIYTSGSTGKPKGAMVEHIGMMNHIHAKINDMQLTGKSIVAQNASHTFDISVWQFFVALVLGGQTVIYSNELVLEPMEFISQLTCHGVTILEVVPSYLSVLLDTLDPYVNTLDTLCYLLVTGEAIMPNLVKRWFEKYPDIKIVNAYGPTEASDDITHYFIEKAPDDQLIRVPIGKPLQNFNIYIVDKYMNLCPIGVKGEIWVSGIGVGRGYLNDQERTARGFTRDPFVKEPGVRLYKTGDLGRRLADGAIEFFGRKDYQVKIRGFRIELEEIESRLIEHPGIKEAVVIDREDQQGNKYLCAYLTGLQSLKVAEVKEYLSEHLPEYMVPAYVVILDRIPLTSNGKIDRKALPAPPAPGATTRQFIPCISGDILENVVAPPPIGPQQPGRIEVEADENDNLSSGEKEKILYRFNNTRFIYPHDKSFCQLFQECVQQAPHKVVFIYGNAKITYGELNVRAQRLALQLRAKGVGRGTIVGLLADRSLELLVGWMAILKSGGTYLPIDPQYPAERVRYMLEDSRTGILVTNLSSLPLQPQVTIDLNDSSNYAEEPLEPLPIIKPLDLAYVIYTSGTTGRPKGVMVEHRPIVNFAISMNNILGFEAEDVILSLSTLSFDMVGTEVFPPLIKGLTVIVGSSEEQLHSTATARVMDREKVTIFQVTPSNLQTFISEEEYARCLRPLKLLLVGAEKFPDILLEKVKDLTAGKIFNLYGPTETTTWSTAKEMTHEKTINVGKPIANTQVYILDKNHNIRPVDKAGELCIGGDGVARGYLNKPELTHEKFPMNPFVKGGRMYKTGDLARWVPDGNIDFIGRADYQVQIGGLRIELGEIECVLLKYEGIKQAVVVVKESRTTRQKLLYAYVVSEENLVEIDLREYMSGQLPLFMIPARFFRLGKMPLTPNGKINRKLLETLEVDPGEGALYEAPKTDDEKIIAQLWKEVLGLEKVGIHDNFFELGGNSLLCIKLVNRLKEAFKREIPVVSMFRYLTIHSFSRYLNQEGERDELTTEGQPQKIDEAKTRIKQTLNMMKKTRDN